METQQIENKEEEKTAEAFFVRIEEYMKSEEEKLKQMDGDKNVSKEEYRTIQEQAKLVAFLKAMREPAKLYLEAVEKENIPLTAEMKKYLNIV
jgi:hypothetical protein